MHSHSPSSERYHRRRCLNVPGGIHNGDSPGESQSVRSEKKTSLLFSRCGGRSPWLRGGTPAARQAAASLDSLQQHQASRNSQIITHPRGAFTMCTALQMRKLRVAECHIMYLSLRLCAWCVCVCVCVQVRSSCCFHVPAHTHASVWCVTRGSAYKPSHVEMHQVAA